MAEILPERCVPITKKELLYWGPLGFSGWLCNLVFIDRKKKHQARDTLEHLLRVWVYPEGTRNREDTMLPFKRGAFHLAIKAQVPIVPIVISSYTDFYSVKDKRFDPGKSKWQRTIIPPPVMLLSNLKTLGLDRSDNGSICEIWIIYNMQQIKMTNLGSPIDTYHIPRSSSFLKSLSCFLS
uniref:1-acylglycerol-3-phosphate O-acyltransferase n=1 Tax=Naja naja TaxID=35670 RepID=A0A8C6VL37_NAJNA